MKADKKLVIAAGIIFFASVCMLISFYPDWKEESKDSLFYDEIPGNFHQAPGAKTFEKPVQDDSTRTGVAVTKKFVNVDGVKIHTVSVGSKPQFPILLLHGQVFSSVTWENLDTLQALGNAGFHVTAIDLPGYGESKETSSLEPEVFLDKLIPLLGLEKPVIVSPSMSGRFAVPFVLHHPDKVSGFVPVSPVINPSLTKEDFQKSKVPTLIIYGEEDAGAAPKNELLSGIQGSRVEEIPNGKHPCYLDDPNRFHRLIIEFVNGLK